MARTTLEARVARLEAQIVRLSDEVRAGGQRADEGWRRAVDLFAGDEDLRSVLEDAMKLREAERGRARRGPSDTRKRRP
ncbi:MAG: hypothetical protein ACLQNE_06490 [Thermoguttaceae bacterium]